MYTLVVDNQIPFESDQYKIWKFMGGEIHFKVKDLTIYQNIKINIVTRLNNSDNLIALCIIVDTLHKDFQKYGTLTHEPYIEVYIPYLPYQQADRDFGLGECFSLSTSVKILNSLGVNRYNVFMPHSENSINLLKSSIPISDNLFIRNVISKGLNVNDSDITILTPDAGAYKRINGLLKSINFTGKVAAANKYRNISSGNIESIEISQQDFNKSDILIIDDLCMGGGTFIGLADKLSQLNCGNLYLAVSHMVPQKVNTELFNKFTKVFTTNSRFENFIVDNELVSTTTSNQHLYVYDIMKVLTIK